MKGSVSRVIIASNKTVTALLLLIIGGGAGLIALMLILWIAQLSLYSNGSLSPQEPTEWFVIGILAFVFPPLLYFFFKLAFSEIMNLIRNFDSRVEMREDRVIHQNNRERTEILMKDIVEITSFRGRFGRFTHEIKSANGSKITLDAWRYRCINDAITEITRHRGVQT